MANPKLLLTCASLAALLGGCTTFGTNIEGDFSCRALKGDCAPAHVTDARATASIQNGDDARPSGRVRSVGSGDTSRTNERTLRIVFPAHVDAFGTLHDEAVAWAVIENPRWTAELRRKPAERGEARLLRQLGRQIEAAQSDPDADAQGLHQDADQAGLTAPLFVPAPSNAELPVASPLALPSTAREAVAGAQAPAVEGFDMSPPHDRTPRPDGGAPALTYPAAEAIEAAKATLGEERK